METIEITESSAAQEITVPKTFGKIICPCRILVSGPTMSGKSSFALELISNRDLVFDKEFSRIISALPEDSIHLHQDFIKKIGIIIFGNRSCRGTSKSGRSPPKRR